MSPTLHFGGTVLPAAAFHDRCVASAAALRELGLGPGDCAALMCHNEPVLLELMLAARAIGVDYCMINWHFKSAEVRHILTDSEAPVLVVHANLLPQIHDGVPAGVRVFVAQPLEGTRRAFAIDETALAAAAGLETWASFRETRRRAAPAPQRPGSMRVYTSGTTGLPKGVRRQPPTPEQVQRVAEMCATTLGMERGMRALMCAPMYHSAPAGYVVQAALQDADLWIEPRFDAEAILRLIEAERISHLYMVPTMMRRLLQLAPDVRARYDLNSVRFSASTGAPCDGLTKQRMIEWWGPVFHEAYAASELGYITHIDSHEALRKPGSAGRALAGATVKVLAEDGEALAPGRVGLIYARHSGVTDFTYTHNPEARRRLERDGLWTLGDMGYLDEDGYLFIVDRSTDMVISGGVNIYPAEIEAVLLTMPGIADCAVFGVPDDDYGESLLAAVQTTEGASVSAESVQAWLRDHLANYKVPRRVVFHAHLPREETGKIFKRKLREPYWAGRDRRV
jgi:long-chain acyl-CoA synthetase